jgi:hypothetical protein
LRALIPPGMPQAACLALCYLTGMTRSQIRAFVEASSKERIREVLDLMQKVKNRVPPEQLPEKDRAFLLDLRDHEAFFRELADAKLQQ